MDNHRLALQGAGKSSADSGINSIPSVMAARQGKQVCTLQTAWQLVILGVNTISVKDSNPRRERRLLLLFFVTGPDGRPCCWHQNCRAGDKVRALSLVLPCKQFYTLNHSALDVVPFPAECGDTEGPEASRYDTI